MPTTGQNGGTIKATKKTKKKRKEKGSASQDKKLKNMGGPLDDKVGEKRGAAAKRCLERTRKAIPKNFTFPTKMGIPMALWKRGEKNASQGRGKKIKKREK